MKKLALAKLITMDKIDIPDGNNLRFFDYHEIICMQARSEYAIIFVVDASAEKGYSSITASYCLKSFEEKVKDYPFMRVHNSWVVGLKHVKGLAKNNTITLSFNCCESVPLKPELRKTFIKKMKMHWLHPGLIKLIKSLFAAVR